VPTSQTENYRVAPSWAWQWTSRDQLILGTSYSKTSYNNSLNGSTSNIGTGFSGNDTYSVNLGGNHEWSRRLSLNENFFFQCPIHCRERTDSKPVWLSTGRELQNQSRLGHKRGWRAIVG